MMSQKHQCLLQKILDSSFKTPVPAQLSLLSKTKENCQKTPREKTSNWAPAAQTASVSLSKDDVWILQRQRISIKNSTLEIGVSTNWD